VSVKRFLTQNAERRTLNSEVENTIKCALAYSRQSEYHLDARGGYPPS